VSIFGTDTARYQAIGTYDPGAFEIVNIEDPQFLAKKAKNDGEGRPTDFYVWCYTNDQNETFFRWAIAKAKAAGVTRGWLDYEEQGPEGSPRVDTWFRVADEQRIKSGYYANDWRLDHTPYLGRPFWLAGYPDPNDGVWRDGYKPQSNRPVQLWQYSSGGGMDRDIVIDETWWNGWIGNDGPTPEAAPGVPMEEDAMRYVIKSGTTSARLKERDLLVTDDLSVELIPAGKWALEDLAHCAWMPIDAEHAENIWFDKDRTRGLNK